MARPVITRRYIPEHHIAGKRRLGRHVEHDSRSRDYRVPTGLAPATKVWARPTKAFDQGNLGSCTGNAIVGMAATAPNRTKGHRYNEALAVKVYELATTLDSISGSFPPDDTGSTGLAACKAAVKLSLAKSYRWAFGIDDLVGTVSHHGPCAVGTNWHVGMDSPDAKGLVTITGAVRGGHEYEVIGYHLDTSLGAPEPDVFECQNSWGVGWGVKGTGGKGGRFFIRRADMATLLAEGGDACTFSAPVPTTPDQGATAVKPGYLTTEFYLTAGSLVLAFLAALRPGIDVGHWRAVITTAAPLAAAIASGIYAMSRAKVKAAEALTAAAAMTQSS